MTHNIQVTVVTLAMGMTWGVGTIILLFYNGVILGAVAADYVCAGFAHVPTGWLLPHGSIEIPAILLGGQGGFMLAGALIGWGGRSLALRPSARRGARPLRHRRGRGGHAGVGRDGGSIHLAIPPARDSLRPQDRLRTLANWRRSPLSWAGGARPRMKAAMNRRAKPA